MTTKESTKSKNSRGHIVVLLLILLIGLALRIAAMNGRALLDDELGSALGVEKTYGYLITGFGGWLTQPGYFLLAKLFSQLFGVSEFAVRLPSLVFGVLGIIAVYFLAAKLFDERVGIAAALLTALNPYHVFYSQMARGYAMAATLSVFSLLSFLFLVETRKCRHLIYYVLSTTLAIYCHLGCIGVMICQFLSLCFVAYQHRGDPDLVAILRSTVTAMAIVSALAFCLYFPALRDILQFRQGWTGGYGELIALGFVPLTLTRYAGGRGWSIYVFSLFSVLGMVRLIRRDRCGAIVLLTWPLGVFLFYWANAASHYPWAYARFFLIAQPALIIAAAGGLVAIVEVVPNRVEHRMPIAAMGYMAFFSVFIVITSAKLIPISFGGKGVSWPTVDSYLKTSCPPNMHIVHMDFRSSSLPYYIRRMSDVSVQQISNPRSLVRALEKTGEPAWIGNPTVYVVDAVIFEGGRAPERFVVQRIGTTLVLYRRDWEKSGGRETLLDLEMLTKRVIQCLENRSVDEIKNDWAYWRRDPKSESNFVIKKPLVKYYLLLSAIQRRLGHPAQADLSLQVAMQWKTLIPPPGRIRSSWTMLAPHADFLEPLHPDGN